MANLTGAQIAKRYRSKHYMKYYDATRERDLKRKYGISISDYNTLFALQYGKCAICKRHQSEFKTRLAVDHDHKSGKVRGLLCQRCNGRILAVVEAFPDLVRASQIYLGI